MLLILFPYKFTEFYAYLLDIENLENKLKCKVEVHDLSNIINKNWNKSFLTNKSKKCIEFYNYNDWKARFNKLKNDNKLTIFNFLDLNSFKSLCIHFVLYKSKLKIMRLSTSGVIEHNYYYKKNIFDYIKQILSLGISFPKFIYVFKTGFLRLIYKSLFPLSEILLISGSKKQSITNLGKKKIEMSFHSLDYSKALNKKITRKNNNIIYFDSPSPFFKDDEDTIYQNKKSLIKDNHIKNHYKILNRFLSSIEKIYKSKVIIVPHPKVKKIRNPFYDKKFKIANQVDAAESLVNTCKLIICASPSTVVAYAIKNYKPILILEGEGFKNSESAKLDNYLGAKVMIKFIGCCAINYETSIDKKIFIKVNKKKYDNYRFRFLTSKKIIGLKNYQIISKVINQTDLI
tara:strand:- start:81 stop:1286 length:1206 start_codon:yes stop_codon:yes gene_type:complete